jgi:HEAT repeat protein
MIPDRYSVIRAGFSHDESVARAGLHSDDDTVRASAVRALHRMHALTTDDVAEALRDTSREVRRTAVEVSAKFDVVIRHLLDDPDVFVAEMTAWTLGERTNPTDADIDSLIAAVESHSEAVVREASAAALGSIGDERGLPAILKACADKPAVRRRAILALAPFSGDDVDAALKSALTDKDWQVRQNAEILLSPRGS